VEDILLSLDGDSAMGVVGFPAELLQKIREYFAAGKHGNVMLNIKGGKIMSWEITEMGRVDKGIDKPVEPPIP
tara:strand:+ start:282 stop:500 length:219 start_codon:yes stop_codon:yes gene_type:complete